MDHEDLTETPTEAVEREADIRWTLRSYGRYLLAFAVGSLAVAYGLTALGPKYGAALVTPIWVIFLIMISLFAARQQSVVPGLLRLHGVTVASWAGVWMIMLLGSIPLQQPLWWWVIGGVAMTIPPLVSRQVFLPRLSAGAVQLRR